MSGRPSTLAAFLPGNPVDPSRPIKIATIMTMSPLVAAQWRLPVFALIRVNSRPPDALGRRVARGRLRIARCVPIDVLDALQQAEPEINVEIARHLAAEPRRVAERGLDVMALHVPGIEIEGDPAPEHLADGLQHFGRLHPLPPHEVED